MRKIISIDKMTDTQFEKFLSNESFFDVFELAYEKETEQWDELSENQKEVFDEMDNVRGLKLYIERDNFTYITESWKNLSEGMQKKYFQFL